MVGRGRFARLAITTLAIATQLLCMCLCPFTAIATEPSRPTVEAAMGILGFINAVDIQTEQCRKIDSANAASYDAAYVAYHQDLGDIIVRIDFLLTEEATRIGVREDFFISQMPRFADIARREAKRMAETNPGTFLAMCRSLPTSAAQRADVFRPLRKKYPDEMRLIDEWR